VYLYAEKNSKHFELDLSLLLPIVPESSSWQLGSVGRCSFTLVKKMRKKWDRLLSSAKRPQNMHLWWTMQDQYDDELEAMEEEEEKAWMESQKQSKAHFQELQDRKDGKVPKAAAKPKEEEEKGDGKEEEAGSDGDAGEAEIDEEEQKIRKKHEKELKKKLRDINSRRKRLVKDLDSELNAKTKEIDEEMQKKKDEVEEAIKKKKDFVDEEILKDRKAAKEASAKATEEALQALKEPAKKSFSLFGREL